MHQFLKFILEGNSTCFGLFLCPSSRVFHCTHRNVICYTGLLCVQWKNSWWWAEELSETCRISFQNKFEKLVHLVEFIIRNLSRCTVTRTSISSMPNRQRKYISIRTPKKYCKRPTRQYGITHTPLLCVQWKTPDDRQRNFPKHLEVPSKISFRN